MRRGQPPVRGHRGTNCTIRINEESTPKASCDEPGALLRAHLTPQNGRKNVTDREHKQTVDLVHLRMMHAVKPPKVPVIRVGFPLRGFSLFHPRSRTWACLGYSPACCRPSYSLTELRCQRRYGDTKNLEKPTFFPHFIRYEALILVR